MCGKYRNIWEGNLGEILIGALWWRGGWQCGVTAVTSCDVGTTPSDVRSDSNSNGPSHLHPVQWTRPQSLLVFVTHRILGLETSHLIESFCHGLNWPHPMSYISESGLVHNFSISVFDPQQWRKLKRRQNWQQYCCKKRSEVKCCKFFPRRRRWDIGLVQ